MLTYLIEVVPSCLAHRLARVLGLTSVYELFCPDQCCEDKKDVFGEHVGPDSQTS